MNQLHSVALSGLLLALAAAAPTVGLAQRVTHTIPDTIPLGSGPFKAIPSTEPGLPGRTVYAPPQLAVLGTHKLPIVAWAEGGCFDKGTRFRWFLSEIASHGYLVLANGRIGPLAEELWSPPQPGVTENATLPDPATLPPPTTFASQLSEAINWAIAENARAGSRYFGRIDTTKIASMGMSCGGIQAIQIAVSDPRVVTTVLWNSGLFTESKWNAAGESPLITKADLGRLRGSVAYISGDESDMAFANANDDFERLSGIPALRAYRKGTAHSGTYAERNGGDFGKVGVAWLDWRLKGDPVAAGWFTGAHCRLCRDPQWVVQRKDFR